MADHESSQHQGVEAAETVAGRAEPVSGLPVEERIDFQRAMRRIPRADRWLLWLAYGERKSGHELAAALGVAPDAARRRLSRAVQRFRAAMGAGYGRETR